MKFSFGYLCLLVLALKLISCSGKSSLEFLADSLETSPGCGFCTCDSKNNQREIPPNSHPSEPDSYPVEKIYNFSLEINLLWYANNVNNLDLHFKSSNGIDLPSKVDQISEFDNSVRRTNFQGGSYKNEGMDVYPTLPKGSYLLYVFNCSNENPLILTDASVLIKTKTREILKLNISDNMYNVNERIWRIAYIESDGNGEIIIRAIDRVSNSNEVVFDGN